jgi:glucokinase
MNERMAIGIDLGGTFIKAGLINESGQTLGSWKEPTNARKGADAVMEGLLGMTRRILDSEAFQRSRANNAVLAGIGIGSPGAIDFRTGTVSRATGNLPGWTGTPIGPIFEKEFRVRTRVDNDANAYTLGEYLFGAGRCRKPRVMIGLTLGTGVGGGVIIDGRVQHGAHGFAGELGHIALSDREDAPPCSTGIRGCLESYACAPVISQYAEEQKERYPDSLVFQMAQDRPLNTEIIHQAVLQGDPLALHVIDRTATYLGWGLAAWSIATIPISSSSEAGWRISGKPFSRKSAKWCKSGSSFLKRRIWKSSRRNWEARTAIKARRAWRCFQGTRFKTRFMVQSCRNV